MLLIGRRFLWVTALALFPGLAVETYQKHETRFLLRHQDGTFLAHTSIMAFLMMMGPLFFEIKLPIIIRQLCQHWHCMKISDV